MPLIEELCKKGDSIYVAINGLGAHGVELLLSIANSDKLVLMFDSREIDELSFYKKMAWLKGLDKQFGILTDKVEQVELAMLMGAKDAVFLYASQSQIDQLEQLGTYLKLASVPPFSSKEIDLISDKQASLTVKHQTQAGEVLKKECLEICETQNKGIAPYLMNKVIGCTLRYSISPGEPLTFGYLVNCSHGK